MQTIYIAFVNAARDVLVINEAEGSTYGSLSGPSNFGPGTGNGMIASSWSGDIVGLTGPTDLLVPLGYTSGSPLAATETWDGATLAELGVTDGTYVWTWGSGAHADSLTLEIGPVAAVPEPSTWAMMILGFCSIALIAYRRKSSAPTYLN